MAAGVVTTPDIRALARLLTQIEIRDPRAMAQLRALHRLGAAAHVLGITGPPGAGKSTVVDQLIRRLRAQHHCVAVLAIDPSSPFSGGAVLGDRIRMQSHAGDDGVFIRSVGSRGAHGGLARSTRAMADCCAAHGFDQIIIETVGVGQSEYDIMTLADTTLVVLTPESGDTVQTLKAGLLEIADLFVVNKGDRPGAETMAQGLMAMVALGASPAHAMSEDHDAEHRPTAPRPTPVAAAGVGWVTPVLMVTATRGTGIDRLMQQIALHGTAPTRDPALQQRKADLRRRDFLALCGELLAERLHTLSALDPQLAALIDHVAAGTANPYEAAEQLVGVAFRAPGTL